MKSPNFKVVETVDLRKNLSEILENVKHDDVRYKVRRHKRVQASVISDDQADLLFDLSEDQLKNMEEAISLYLKEHKDALESGTLVNLKDVLG